MTKSMTSRAALERELKNAATPERASGAARYFKTGEGEYGAGDIFLGVTVPAMRKIALRYRDLRLDDLQRLFDSKVHEHRAAALEVLVSQYKRGDEKDRQQIFDFYLRNTKCVNNWDLVDASCRGIVGEHLRTRPRKVLDKLARSKSLWERRIAMVSTMPLVWEGETDDALRIAGLLLGDEHDLIHKAVGWLLREVGDENQAVLVGFLTEHYERVPRTALRYAIEHFPIELRKQMLRGKFVLA
jgi:3-methyladenine DNA glycosylase AlkD